MSVLKTIPGNGTTSFRLSVASISLLDRNSENQRNKVPFSNTLEFQLLPIAEKLLGRL